MERESDSIKFVRRGWVEVGGARMALMEIKAGLYELKEVLAREVGETEDELVCHAGTRGTTSLMLSAMESGQVTPDENGFRAAVEMYAEAGFGDFRIVELSWPKGWAVLRCEDSFEGWAYVENQKTENRPKCDYSRGVFSTFMRESHKRAGTGIGEIFAVETQCIAKGDKHCEFLVGVRADLEARGHRIPPPKLSAREKLERSIALLRDSNEQLMKAEMQYRSIFDAIFDSIIIADRELKVLHCNRPAEKFLGLQRRSLLGKKMTEYIRVEPGLSLEEKAGEALASVESTAFEADISKPRGEWQRCRVHVVPMHGEVAFIFHEITGTGA